MLLVLALLCFGLAVYVVGELAAYPHRQQQLAVRRATSYGRARTAVSAVERLRFRQRVVEPAVGRLSRLTLRLNPKVTIEMVGKRLLVAGLSSRITPAQFLALKTGLALAFMSTALLLAVSTVPFAGLFLAPTFGALGFLLPDSVVTLRMRGRRERVRAQLPDALDLLAVSVEAGLGFDGAVAKLTEHMQGDLIDEFALTLGEVRIGESRLEALKKMATRVPAPEVAAFVRSVIQADQLGISLGRILRVQAADSRLRRQAAAEEQAMKAPIKMLIPTVVFIFPAMFLVILGPALINLLHTLK
jgi:tight adherence protein C